MIRQFLLLMGVMLTLLSSFSKGWIVLSFNINRSYISQNLCENKNNPVAPHCKGKCYLNKQLDEDSKKDSRFPKQQTEQVETVLCLPVIALKVKKEKQAIIQFPFPSFYLLPNSQLYYTDIFHPPWFNLV